MNPKTFSKFLVKSFLFSVALLGLVGISPTETNAQTFSGFTIKKDVCDAINPITRACVQGNNNLLDGQTIQFTVALESTVTEGNPTGTIITTIDVLIVNGSGSTTITNADAKDLFVEGGRFRVCEINTPAGFDSFPQPAPGEEGSTGGVDQNSIGDCIRFTNGPGNDILQFANVAMKTTAATATVSGRVKDVNGKSAARVSVTITNVSSGEVLSTRTDMFGRYTFTELATGEDYLLRVFSGRRIFRVNEMFINLMENLTDVDFTVNSAGMKNTEK